MDPEIAAFEQMAAQHWQGTEQDWLGGWLLRAAGGFTGRANSVLPLGDPGLPLAQAVDAAVDWYTRRGLPPMAVIATGLDAGPDELDALLARRGWGIRQRPAVVMTARTARIAELPAASPDGTELSYAAEPDSQWLATYHYLGQDLPPDARTVLLSAPGQVFASVRQGGRTVATGRLSLAGGWAGLTAIDVAADWRRAGLGTAITAGLAAQARDLGAMQMFLQVEEGNAAARALYTRCGFTSRHRYHYRRAPG